MVSLCPEQGPTAPTVHLLATPESSLSSTHHVLPAIKLANGSTSPFCALPSVNKQGRVLNNPNFQIPIAQFFSYFANSICGKISYAYHSIWLLFTSCNCQVHQTTLCTLRIFSAAVLVSDAAGIPVLKHRQACLGQQGLFSASGYPAAGLLPLDNCSKLTGFSPQIDQFSGFSKVTQSNIFWLELILLSWTGPFLFSSRQLSVTFGPEYCPKFTTISALAYAQSLFQGLWHITSAYYAP